MSREAGTVRGSLSQRKEDNSGSDGNGNKGVSPDVPEAVVFVSASVLLKPFCTLEHFKGWVKTGLRVCIQGLADNRPGSADQGLDGQDSRGVRIVCSAGGQFFRQH